MNKENTLATNAQEASGSSLGPADIKIVPEQELWGVTLDLGTKKQVKLSLLEKETWFAKENSTVASQEEEGKFFIPLPQKKKEYIFDTNVIQFCTLSFFNESWSNLKANPYIKTIPVLIFSFFGSLSPFENSYFFMALFCILLGIINDINKKRFGFYRVNKSLFQQVLMLAAIFVFNTFSKVLIDQDFLGKNSLIVCNLVMFWFFVCNFLTVFKYLTQLGVPFPQSWKSKIDLIKTVLD